MQSQRKVNEFIRVTFRQSSALHHQYISNHEGYYCCSIASLFLPMKFYSGTYKSLSFLNWFCKRNLFDSQVNVTGTSFLEVYLTALSSSTSRTSTVEISRLVTAILLVLVRKFESLDSWSPCEFNVSLHIKKNPLKKIFLDTATNHLLNEPRSHLVARDSRAKTFEFFRRFVRILQMNRVNRVRLTNLRILQVTWISDIRILIIIVKRPVSVTFILIFMLANEASWFASIRSWCHPGDIENSRDSCGHLGQQKTRLE